jgi:hypothetical protein
VKGAWPCAPERDDLLLGGSGSIQEGSQDGIGGGGGSGTSRFLGGGDDDDDGEGGRGRFKLIAERGVSAAHTTNDITAAVIVRSGARPCSNDNSSDGARIVICMTALASILRRTPATSIGDVLARMQEIDAALPREDGVACFNKLYMAVTASVIAAEEAATFASPVFLSALDVAFGNLYFSALGQIEIGARPPRAWAPLFAARARQDVAPLQFALAGMNAHINRDLPVGLVQTFASLGLEMSRPSPQSADFDGINAVLVATEASVRDQYFTPLLEELHRKSAGVDDLVANWSVREARAAAWTNGCTLWHLRALPALAADYLETLDGMVGLAGRGLLVPTG